MAAESEGIGPSDNPWEAWGVSVPRSDFQPSSSYTQLYSTFHGLFCRMSLT